MRLRERYRRLTLWNKLAAWGALSSILGVTLTLILTLSSALHSGKPSIEDIEIYIPALQEALEKNQENVRSSVREATSAILHAEEAFKARQYEPAMATYKTALALDPDNHLLIYKIGDCARLLNDYSKAERYYRSVIEIEPDYERAHIGLTISLYRQKKYIDAIEAIDRVLGSEESYYVYASIYYLLWQDKGRYSIDSAYEEALEAYGICQQKNSTWSPWCYYDVACLYALRLRDPELNTEERNALVDKAVTLLSVALDRATSLNPESALRIMQYMASDEDLASIRAQADFQDLIKNRTLIAGDG
ncbi:MAG: tetratricopeptide repeat protein [Proteobacteria bacterium]|nr:tetratricopeptide repeat protein [Pseudomonadota bacterium]